MSIEGSNSPITAQDALVRTLSDRMRSVQRSTPEDTAIAFHQAVCLMYEFSALARDFELSGASPDAIRRELHGAREIMSSSVLVRRLQTWPRGYPGDFETIELIANGVNSSPPGTWAYFLEQSVLHSGAVRQHQNKLRYQSDAIRRMFLRVGPGAHLLTLGCGGAKDIMDALPAFAGLTGIVVLNDIDADALALACQRVALATHKYSVLHCNALKAVKKLQGNSAFDLVIAGGLFDYLSDRAIVILLRCIHKILRPLGELVFTNIACGNPYRPWMEYAADWKLIERDEVKLLSLCEQAEIPLGQVSLQREETGLTILVTVVRS